MKKKKSIKGNEANFEICWMGRRGELGPNYPLSCCNC